MEINVIGHGDGEALASIEAARAAGARVIVGPLLRDDLKALAAAPARLPPTIALNALEDDSVLPDAIYTLALSVEGEARQIARTMQMDGVREVAIVSSDAPLQRRFASSFTTEWILQGGGPPATFQVVRSPDLLATLRQQLLRAPFGGIVLAADANDAAAVKPYLPRTAIYTSSQVNERNASAATFELEDIRFVEMPWLVDAQAPQFAGIPHKEYAQINLERLYALGLDAFQVAVAFDPRPPQQLEMEGATGHLSLGPQHRIVREGRLVRFEGGRVVPDSQH